MADDQSVPGDAASDLPSVDTPLSHTDHLHAAHGHAVGAAAHLAAALADNDADAASESPAEDAGDSPGERSAMMPQGSAQGRAFAFRGGAAHALRQATGGRRG
jgi:hypothetical protein